MKLPPKPVMRQRLQVAGEPMKHPTWAVAALALAILTAGCSRFFHHVPQAATDACAAPKAVLAVRRAALREAMEKGAPEGLIARLRQDAHATLEDPHVQDYQRNSGIVTCTALMRIQPPAPGAQEISSNVTFTGQPLRAGGWRYKLTDPGQLVQAIASLGPLPPEPNQPAASSAAADAVAQTPSSDAEDAQTREDAAAAGDTGHSHRPPPTLR